MQRQYRRERSGKRLEEGGTGSIISPSNVPAFVVKHASGPVVTAAVSAVSSAAASAGPAPIAVSLTPAVTLVPVAHVTATAPVGTDVAQTAVRNVRTAATGGAHTRGKASEAAATALAASRATHGQICGTWNHPVFIPPTGDMASPFYVKSIQPDALKQVPKSPEAFSTFITNFHLGRGHHRFKVPHFGGAELNIYAVFDEVINRGGCLSVTQIKGWREVVRPLSCLPRTAVRYSTMCVRGKDAA
jgi:hypothetical protein